jgi:AraC family transcriptional regulator of adaptative response/methylated-DNA-[protein]-cysteine methyltransferase
VLDPQIEMVQTVCRHLDLSEGESVKLSDLASKTGVSLFHLQRTFKSLMGISPRQYLEGKRFGNFKTRVREGAPITAALYDAGFNSSSRVYENASTELGMTPATYGRRGRGINIKFTIRDSPLGRLLIAITERGVCSVTMGDSDSSLEKALREEFSDAEIERDDAALRQTVTSVLKHLEAKQPHLDLPLDIRATAFQRQVWERLRAIPYGETASYRDVATAIGKPGAVRAVGHACATNPVALVIPCHRVVREDKTLGGYRWGMHRKKKLLDTEKEKASGKTKTQMYDKL